MRDNAGKSEYVVYGPPQSRIELPETEDNTIMIGEHKLEAQSSKNTWEIGLMRKAHWNNQQKRSWIEIIIRQHNRQSREHCTKWYEQ